MIDFDPIDVVIDKEEQLDWLAQNQSTILTQIITGGRMLLDEKLDQVFVLSLTVMDGNDMDSHYLFVLDRHSFLQNIDSLMEKTIQYELYELSGMLVSMRDEHSI
jgi:hypothetical protein